MFEKIDAINTEKLRVTEFLGKSCVRKWLFYLDCCPLKNLGKCEGKTSADKADCRMANSKAVLLPKTKKPPRKLSSKALIKGGRTRIRTADPLLVRQML